MYVFNNSGFRFLQLQRVLVIFGKELVFVILVRIDFLDHYFVFVFYLRATYKLVYASQFSAKNTKLFPLYKLWF